MQNIQGFIFDLDGTILDSMQVWRQIDIDFLRARNRQATEEYFRQISLLSFPEAAKYTIQAYSLKEKEEDIIKEWREMSISAYKNSIALKPGVHRYLDYLKAKNAPMCIATACAEELFIPALKNNNILEYFSCCTQVSEVKRGKGFPDIYEKSAEKMHLPIKSCAVFEDLYQSIRAAKDAGFYTVGVYDEHSEKDREKILQTADRFITDYKQLIPSI